MAKSVVKLVSREGVAFKVDAKIAEVSDLVRDTLASRSSDAAGDHGSKHKIFLPDTPASALKHVVRWYKHHYGHDHDHDQSTAQIGVVESVPNTGGPTNDNGGDQRSTADDGEGVQNGASAGSPSSASKRRSKEKKTVKPIPGMYNDPCEGMDVWDFKLMSGLDEVTQFQVILAADKLKMNDLMQIGCRKVARAIKMMSKEDMKRLGDAIDEAEKLMNKNANKRQQQPPPPPPPSPTAL